jgi:hypothetical protein
MNAMRRTLWVLLAVSVSVHSREAAAQASPEQSTEKPKPAFLEPPPRERIAEGLQPLSSKLPDTQLREGIRPVDVSEGMFDQRATQYAAHRGDGWVPIQYCWAASELCHRPLYFEDAMLERHGQTRRPLVQPLASGTRFLLTFPVLPYAMVVDPPCSTQTTLGQFRPGSGAPLLLQRPPLQANAGLVEAGVWVGLIFLIP